MHVQVRMHTIGTYETPETQKMENNENHRKIENFKFAQICFPIDPRRSPAPRGPGTTCNRVPRRPKGRRRGHWPRHVTVGGGLDHIFEDFSSFASHPPHPIQHPH